MVRVTHCYRQCHHSIESYSSFVETVLPSTYSKLFVKNQTLIYHTCIYASDESDPIGILPKSLATENQIHRLLYGVVYIMLCLAISTELRLVTDEQTGRWTQAHSIYCARTALCGKKYCNGCTEVP